MDINLDHVWLPYTQHLSADAPPLAVSAEGCKIILEDGREVIDGISSWWSVCHGHRHPALVKALIDQAGKMPHTVFASFANEPAYRLCERLAKLTKLERVFLSDSGSTAVEVAMKMAVQFWKNQNKNSQKSKFLHFAHSYHGDTMGPMSVSDSRGIHGNFVGHVPMQFRVEVPLDELAFEDFEALLEESHKQLAGVIIEPLVQCAGGMRFHSADVLAEIHRIVKKFDLVFIADEVATGFGRTGYMYACEEAGISPDIMCIGKALTGGMMTLAATCTSSWLFDGFKGEPEKAFMHGPTYMGNALACAVANASLDLFESEPRLEQIARIEEIMQAELSKCAALDCVKDVRVKGALGVVEVDETIDTAPMKKAFIDQGYFIRPFGNIIYLAPPFVIEEAELVKLCGAVFEALR